MKITFLGGGNMANALIGGMLKNGFAAADITVIEPGGAARDKLTETYTVNCLEAAEMLGSAGELLVLAVKPQQMKEAVAPLTGRLGNAVVVSIAAGLDLAKAGYDVILMPGTRYYLDMAQGEDWWEPGAAWAGAPRGAPAGTRPALAASRLWRGFARLRGDGALGNPPPMNRAVNP